MAWYQYFVTLPAKRRGFHLITREVIQAVDELPSIRIGILHVFIQHTSAAITLNENADPDVRSDLDSYMARLVKDGDPVFEHTAEGPDDMSAHIRTIISGSDLTLPVSNGQCDLGTWQGVYLWEHRTAGYRRKLTVTVHGE